MPTPNYLEVRAKRERLKELLGRLGTDATPDEIREAAYREGIGQVNPHMLVTARNQLWPDRAKRTRGPTVRAAATLVVLPPGVEVARGNCPGCSSVRISVRTRHIHSDGSCTRFWSCRDCGNQFKLDYPNAEPLPRLERLKHALEVEKECTKCRLIKPVSAFGKKARDPHLWRSHCNDCLNLMRRVSYGKRSILIQYGITPEQYEEMYARQGGLCAVCDKPESGKRAERKFALAIDHCHTPPFKVRQLLCNKCNLGLGNFDDDPARLEAAAAYLRRHAT